MYQERPSRLGGAMVWWSRVASPAGEESLVLPDGCMDLIWDGRGLLVAGPDTRAHPATAGPDAYYAGLRFPPGTAPAVLGVPADELRDQRVPLAALWSAARAGRLAERVAAAPDPVRALEDVMAGRWHEAVPDPVSAAVVAALRDGIGVASTAYAVNLSERQLHRRCLAAFGYGPKTLARVLRMERALRMARGGVPLAAVAARAGYADQAHLSRDIKALAGVPVLQLVGRSANRSTALPSGSWTMA